MAKQAALIPTAPAPLAFSPVATGILQRKCACGQHTGNGECESCRKAFNTTGRRAAVVATRSASTSTYTSCFDCDLSRIRTRTGGSEQSDPLQMPSAIPPDLRTETQTGSPSPGTGGTFEPYCKVTGSFGDIPSGNVPATLKSNKLSAEFKMIGNFDSNIPCTCSCGEYRQYVRGKFTANGTVVPHSLGGGRNLDPVNYQEDGDVAAGTVYGHRAVPGTKSVFKPDQAGGCRFEGADEPGIGSSTKGTALGINLDFKVNLIDTCRGGTSIANSAWNVAGTATIP